MRIIKPGKLPSDWFRATCHNCKCEFEYHKQEAARTNYGEALGPFYFVKDCPSCGKECRGLRTEKPAEEEK